MIHPFYLDIYMNVYKGDISMVFPKFQSYVIEKWLPISLELNFDLYHYSTPVIKLYYPEPFIASPQFSHEDYWFLHIVIYQYWLWFFFIYCIIFYFLVFLITVRWGNLRYRPGRETRGVSRSKCGDLITATVPVTWAASIIIHESVDAVEFVDGFGTTEVSIGIRAYQWGWEYYYPQDLAFQQSKRTTPLVLGYSDYFDTPKKGSFRFDKSLNTTSSNFTDSINTNSLQLLLPSTTSSKLFNSIILDKLTLSNNKLLVNHAIKYIRSSRVNTWRNFLFFSPRTNLFSSLNQLFYIYKNYWEVSIVNESSFFNSQTYVLQKTALISPSFNYSNRWFLAQYMSLKDNYAVTIQDLAKSLHIINFYKCGVLWYNYSTHKLLYNFTHLTSLLKGIPTFTNQQYTPSSIYLFNDFKNLYLKVWLILQSSLSLNLHHHSQVDYKRIALNELTEDYLFNFYNIIPTSYKETGISFKNQEDGLQQLQIHTYMRLFWLLNQFISTTSRVLWHNDQLRSTFEDFSFLFDFNSLQDLLIFKNYTTLELTQLDLWNESLFTNAYFQYFLFNVKWVLNRQTPWTFILNSPVHTSSPLVTWMRTFNNFNFKSIFLNLKSSEVTWAVKFYDYYTPFLNYHNFSSFKQAFLKVFKPIYDDSRSSLTLEHLNSLLIKTSVNFFQEIPKVSNFLKLGSSATVFSTPYLIHKKKFELFSNLFDLNNFTYITLPFDIAKESDVMRGVWMDWYSPRTLILAKAIDLAQFGLYGAKLHSYNFTNPQTFTKLNQFETFFNKYLYSRKFYLPYIINFPFFYFNFYKKRFAYTDITAADVSYLVYTHNLNFITLKSFLELFSNLNTFFYFIDFEFLWRFNLYWSSYRSFIQFGDMNLMTPYNKITLTTRFLDTLTRRNFMFNSFFLYTPKNWFFWDDLLLHRFVILKDFFYVDSWAKPKPLNLPNKLTGGISSPALNFLDTTLELPNLFWKDVRLSQTSQYQPFKKGVANMIRIQADKAVGMPTDVRLQILAVSKDIIHSWAIPSAGVKIDCIPGYSSHRIICFSISGIYWGQCMEICGRFHHWMPIVVYFVKREIFLMWCIHFVFNNDGFNKHCSGLYKSPEARVSHPWSYWFEDDFKF